MSISQLALKVLEQEPLERAPASEIENSAPSPARHEERWLLGLPSLSRFLGFVEESGIDGARESRAALAEAWRAANDYYQALERSEPGLANAALCREPDEATAALFERVKGHAHFRRTFDTLPTDFGMVPLDLLIVSQKHVTWSFVERLKERIGERPGTEALFALCMPLERPGAPVEVRRVGSRRYVFRCESTDFRFHEPVVLQPQQLAQFEASGAVAGVVGLTVGFGCNFLNAVRVGSRLMLNNGYHRACALRALGVTHAPCIIQTATRIDELATVAKREVVQDAEFYFESARPPLLKDFFDEKIRKSIAIRPRIREIEVNFEIKEFTLPR